jgi:hypothetical protein
MTITDLTTASTTNRATSTSEVSTVQARAQPQAARSWARNYLPTRSPNRDHCVSRLSYLSVGNTNSSQMNEPSDQNVEMMHSILTKDRNNVRSWACCEIKVKMSAQAQALGMGVERSGQSMSNITSIKEAYKYDASAEMSKKIFSICYECFVSSGISWEFQMEGKYMRENNITYKEDSGDSNIEETKKLKGCIARLISQRLNEMRAAIRKIGTDNHQHSVQVRQDNGDNKGAAEHKKRKGSTSRIFDGTKHVRSKVMAGDTRRLVGDGTTEVADSDEVCILDHATTSQLLFLLLSQLLTSIILTPL